MTDPKKNPTPDTITEAGAVELAESDLDQASGGGMVDVLLKMTPPVADGDLQRKLDANTIKQKSL